MKKYQLIFLMLTVGYTQTGFANQIHELVQMNDIAGLRAQLAPGWISFFKPNINEREPLFQQAPLHMAAARGNPEMAKLLIENGAIVDIQGYFETRQTPLHLASGVRHNEAMISLLIEKGANVDAVAESLYTPLCVAVANGLIENASMLLQKRAAINGTNYSKVPLKVAAEVGNLKMVDLLVKNGADLNIGYTTPLFVAARGGHRDIVRYLIMHGATVRVDEQAAALGAPQFRAEIEEMMTPGGLAKLHREAADSHKQSAAASVESPRRKDYLLKMLRSLKLESELAKKTPSTALKTLETVSSQLERTAAQAKFEIESELVILDKKLEHAGNERTLRAWQEEYRTRAEELALLEGEVQAVRDAIANTRSTLPPLLVP